MVAIIIIVIKFIKIPIIVIKNINIDINITIINSNISLIENHIFFNVQLFIPPPFANILVYFFDY